MLLLVRLKLYNANFKVNQGHSAVHLKSVILIHGCVCIAEVQNPPC